MVTCTHVYARIRAPLYIRRLYAHSHTYKKKTTTYFRVESNRHLFPYCCRILRVYSRKSERGAFTYLCLCSF